MNEVDKQLNSVMNMLHIADTIKKVSSNAGEFFAVLLVADLEKLERSLLDGLAAYEKICKENPDSKSKVDVAPIHDKIALLGCLMRFRDEVAKSTKVGKACAEKYEKIKKVMDII